MHLFLASLFIAGIPAALSKPLHRGPCHDYNHNISQLPNVTILATGGTIASSASSNTQTTDYRVGVTIDTLIDAVPALCNISNVSGYQVTNIDSSSMNTTILLELVSRIEKELSDPAVQGVVVTHGTDTMEETAFFLDLVIKSEKPVIVTGAMRPSTAMSADGPLNLYQAVKLAASDEARGRGVMITLNDRIGSAYTTTKNNSNSLDTFYSTDQGQLGFFINQVPKFYSTPATPRNKQAFDLKGARVLPQVDILYGHQDSTPNLIEASANYGAKGIVFAGVGAGGWSLEGLEVAGQVHERTSIPMVFSRRTNDGFSGGNAIFSYQITSGFLNPQKSRIMLQLALHSGYSEARIRDLFEGL